MPRTSMHIGFQSDSRMYLLLQVLVWLCIAPILFRTRRYSQCSFELILHYINKLSLTAALRPTPECSVSSPSFPRLAHRRHRRNVP
ncbi:hypothetical protein BD311DRAFT_757987 [Dichomitus squalens]|uniref:Uncharacterized protein n=1 Tax=Dichomitus squalens TaxID=114155 RepID=A0A4Q9MQN7_9APHY|nr:hypothetical protein BD311DRAFT_757987 [Dichomitus squalens]